MTTATTVNVQFQLRADTAANWTAENPILLANEFALETDTKKLKVGDGTTAWASLAYFPSIVSGGTVLGNLKIGSTGTLTFEGSTANDYETTLAVTDPTADRTITLPDQSGTVVVSGNASITNADIAANAEIAVSKLANGTANQVLVTDGTDVSWSDDLTLAGNLTVNGTTTTVNTETLTVKDKNIELAVVDTPTDVTADGGGITLKGATDKTINWIDATDSWTSSENIDLANGKSYRINDTEVLSATTLGSGVTSSSLTSVGTLGSVTVTGDATAGTFIPTSDTAPSNGLYLPETNSVALSTNGTGRLLIDASGNVGIDSNTLYVHATNNRVGIGTSSPSAKLTITDSATPYIRIERPGIPTWQIQNNLITSEYGFSVNNVSSGTTPFFIGDSGRVGIGTTSPLRSLHISDDAPVQVNLTSSSASTSILFFDANTTDAITIGTVGDELRFRTDQGAYTFRTNNGTSEAVRIDSSGRLLVNTSSDSGGALLQVNGDRIRVATAKTPSSASDTGTAGEICWDASYIYVCTATNTWKRAALSTW